MERAIFDCPAAWRGLLPVGTQCPETVETLLGRTWDLLALTPHGCGRLKGAVLRCHILLLPGDQPPPRGAGTVISCGLSPRDSLTLSSLAEPVLCIQRALPRPDGTVIEPQEFPLPPLPGPPETLLPLLGLRLLTMSPGMSPFDWKIF